MPEPQPTDSLAEFADRHGLGFAAKADLPKQGSTLCENDGKVEGAANGTLPGGIEGTLAHYTYTHTWTDSDNNSHTEVRRFTIVVTQIPESIGFLPYFGFAGGGSKLSPNAGGEDMAPIDLGDSEGFKHAHACAYKGTSETWLAQLLSPALVDWLARSEDDFGFELADGVLCVGRDGYLSDDGALEALCEDAAHLAGAIREESLEEVGTGGAESEAAKDPNATDPKMDAALGKVKLGSPAHIAAARGAFSSFLARSPSTFLGALKTGVLWALILSIPGAAIPILLVVGGQYALLAAIEGGLALLIATFSFRSRVRKGAEKYAAEAFYRAYAVDRKLTIEQPLRFAATHAEAKLPFKPDRVFSGELRGGITGALALVGDGTKRSDRVAIVAGPNGPITALELKSNPPGLSAKDLDDYSELLAGELKPAPA